MNTVASNYFKVITKGCLANGAQADLLDPLIEGGLEALNNPARRFSTDSLLNVLNESAAHTGDTALGIKVGLQLRTDTFVDVGFTLTFAENLKEVMALNTKYQTLTQQLGKTEMKVGRSLARVHWFQFEKKDPQRYRHFVEMIYSGYATIGRWLIFGGPNPVRHMQFMHSAPENIDVHQMVFGENIVFDAEKDMMAFPARLTRIPLPTRNEEMKAMMLPKLDRQMDELGRPQSFRRQTMHILQSTLTTGRPKISDVARMMSMSERSFRRHLDKENVRFREILEDARREACEVFLRQNNLNHAEIGARLGYTDQSSYTRAFRSWFGVTPSRYRKGVAQNERTA